MASRIPPPSIGWSPPRYQGQLPSASPGGARGQVDPGLIRENSRKITAIPKMKESRPEGVRFSGSAKAVPPKPKGKIDFRNHRVQAESMAQGLGRAQAAGSAGAAVSRMRGYPGNFSPRRWHRQGAVGLSRSP